MSTRPRMSDLAASAGVSVSTVSRVLNGKPGIRENTVTTVKNFSNAPAWWE